MYILPHCGLASALIRQHQVGRTVTVCADWKMCPASGCHLGELILAGIPVYVKKQSGSWMMYDKNCVIDNKAIISGSANWPENALGSAGTVHIFAAPGTHVIKTAFRENIKRFVLLEIQNVVNRTTCTDYKDRLSKNQS